MCVCYLYVCLCRCDVCMFVCACARAQVCACVCVCVRDRLQINRICLLGLALCSHIPNYETRVKVSGNIGQWECRAVGT